MAPTSSLKRASQLSGANRPTLTLERSMRKTASRGKRHERSERADKIPAGNFNFIHQFKLVALYAHLIPAFTRALFSPLLCPFALKAWNFLTGHSDSSTVIRTRSYRDYDPQSFPPTFLSRDSYGHTLTLKPILKGRLNYCNELCCAQARRLRAF